jgi:uncharacterized protein
MKCPRCDSVLTHIHSQFLDDCPDCGGTWYDHDEMRRSKDAEDVQLDWLDFEFWAEERHFKPSSCENPCPRCNGILVALDYGETRIEVDTCPSCRGIWLDRGEFAAILRALEEEAASMTVSDYVRTALSEAGELVKGPEGRISEWNDFKHVLGMLGLRLFVEKPGLVKTLLALQSNSPLK